MNFMDAFDWIVLIVLISLVVAIILGLGLLPGSIARRRGHPWAEAVAAGSWAALVFGFVLWPIVLVWAYVDVPIRKEAVR